MRALTCLIAPALLTLLLAACQGPDVVIGHAVEAARDGDRQAYAACFTPRSRAVLQTWWQATDAHNPPLSTLGAGDVRILSVQEVRSRDTDTERALVTVSEGAERMRLVLHHSAGTWRIDLLDTERAMLGVSGF